MATPMTASQIKKQLEKWGVTYKEYKSWSTHHRPASTGNWGPVNGFMVHHTGSDSTDQRELLYNGTSALPGPLCQFGLAQDGTVWLIGWGRANHAGSGDPDVLSAVINENYGDNPPTDNESSVDGNARFYGVEIWYSGSHAMSDKQYASLRKLAAAICDFHKWSEKSVIGHGEWGSPGKWDPGISSGKMMDMSKVRSDVKGTLNGTAVPPTPSNPASVTPKSRIDAKTMNSQVTAARKQWPFIDAVEKEYNLLKGTLYALGSRETNLKNVLGDGGHGHGVWQRDNRYWDVDASYLNDVKKQATDAAKLLVELHKTFNTWQGAFAAYNAGPTAVKKALSEGKTVDTYTTGGDYAADVLGRRLLIETAPPKEEDDMPSLDEIAKAVVAELRSSQVTVDAGAVQLKDAWRRTFQNTVDLKKAAADLQKEVSSLKAALASAQNEITELQASVEGKLTEEAIKAALANAQITLKLQ